MLTRSGSLAQSGVASCFRDDDSGLQVVSLWMKTLPAAHASDWRRARWVRPIPSIRFGQRSMCLTNSGGFDRLIHRKWWQLVIPSSRPGERIHPVVLLHASVCPAHTQYNSTHSEQMLLKLHLKRCGELICGGNRGRAGLKTVEALHTPTINRLQLFFHHPVHPNAVYQNHVLQCLKRNGSDFIHPPVTSSTRL